MNPQQTTFNKILWFCFTGCIVVYFLIGTSMLSQNNKPTVFRIGELSGFLFVFFALLSLVVITIIHTYLPKFLETNDDKKKINVRLTQYALSEAIAIMGFVSSLLNGSFTQLIVLSGLSLVSFLKLFPQETQV
jgi:hypothetical protein